jgi:lipopolysaccharide transport system permease protein
MHEPTELIIEAGHAERHYWRELWRYRELFYFFAWKDILVRYKQTVVGIGWAVIRPLLLMIVFTVVFQKVMKMPADGVPYPLTAYVGILAWTFFATSLQDSGTSLVLNSNLISKVYFPRLVIPAASVITALLDFLVAAALLAILFVWFRFVPSEHIIALPLFIAMAFAGAIGGGLWLSALMVRYRDVRFVIPFIVQVGLYVSPVWFKTGRFPEHWRILYSLNPVVGVIDGFRWAILGGPNDIYWPGMTVSLVVTALLLVTGAFYFRNTERTFADII